MSSSGSNRLNADLTEHGWNLYRDMRDAAIEITFHSLYGTPWMRRLGAARHARPQIARHRASSPTSSRRSERPRCGGYAEGVIRMLILLARARGSVRRDRLERSDKLLHSRPPFNSMTPEVRSHMIYEQSLIVQFAGNEAITTLADLLNDPVDRYRSLNLVLDVAGPVEDMDAPTTAMFMRFQRALLTLAREWRTSASSGARGRRQPTARASPNASRARPLRRTRPGPRRRFGRGQARTAGAGFGARCRRSVETRRRKEAAISLLSTKRLPADTAFRIV